MPDLNYVVCCDSAGDLSLEECKARNIITIPYKYTLGDKDLFDDLVSITPERFFKTMEEGAMTRTSQPNSEDYVKFWEPFLEKGTDIVHLCLSSGLSGGIISANVAKELCAEKYRDRKIYVVDSLAASRGLGLFADKLADMRDEGKSAEELYKWAEEHKLNLHHWFYTTDLTYFVRGGRVSKASGWVGSILNICPLLHVDFEGHLIPVKKCRGKKAVMKAMLDMMAEYAENGDDYSEKCFICNAERAQEAKEIAEYVEDHYKKLNGKVHIGSIGPVIGAHTGPGTVALFFWGKKRTN
jgi:DegV family protein with EDD domain